MKTKLTTTLKLLRQHGACTDGYKKLRQSLGAAWPAGKPINLLHILKSNGVQDMMWCLRATEQDCLRERYLICADMAESVLHLFTAQYPADARPALAIQAARDAAAGKIKNADAATAAHAAANAANAAYAAYAADAATAAHAANAANAAYAAYAANAAYVADAATAATAAYAAYAANAAYVADAATAATAANAAHTAYAATAANAAHTAAYAAELKKQATIIRKYLCE